MKKLHIDLTELCIARETETAELAWFLDIETGAVILLNPEYEPAKNGGLQPHEIEGNPNRFVPVTAQRNEDTQRDLKAFCDQVRDVQLKETLSLALAASRPEKRFKTLLQWLPEELGHWRQFRREACESRARTWLKSIGIEMAQRAA
jgi:Uncharacterised protein family (UPF0158)